MTTTTQPLSVTKAVLGSIATLLVIMLILAGTIAGWKSFHRYQIRADARNNVKVSAIQIQNQAQRVKITKQQAAIRFEKSRGVREAQDEIAKTLTPLYVQFEMVEALKEIAHSGNNSSVVYLPSGANGIPLVSGVAGQPSVGQPDGK